MQARSSLDCDVIIVNYNAGILLINCISSVFAAGAVRIIVVDNCSKDSSLADLGRIKNKENLLIIRNDKNLGFATACNIGFKESTTQNVLFLNPDCVMAKDALLCMVTGLNSLPNIGMVGGLLCTENGSEQRGARRNIPTLRSAFMVAFGFSKLAKIFHRHVTDFQQHYEPMPKHPVMVEAISGACMLVKREAITDVGLWDEGYFMHCEDLDWCLRFKQKNWQILFVPDAKIMHIKGGCSRNIPIFVEWHKHRGMLRFYYKFFHYQYPWPLLALVSGGVWLRFSLLVIWYTMRSVLAKITECLAINWRP